MSLFSGILIAFLLLKIALIRGNDIKCESCQNEQKYCSKGEDCNVECNGLNSCQTTSIQCPKDYNCSVTCSGNFACDRIMINATDSSSFELKGCSTGNTFTCSGITIYFPQSDDNGNERAFINGGNHINGRSQPLQFYAQNGWKDIDTSGYKGTFAYFYGTMHCSDKYQTTCDFDVADWSCGESINSPCNDAGTLHPLESTHSTTSKFKASDILLMVVIILVICVCWFGLILIYYVHKGTAFQYKGDELTVKKSININKNEMRTPIRDLTAVCTFDIQAIAIEKQMSREGDIQTFNINNKPETMSEFPANPVQKQKCTHAIPNRLPFINYDSVESYHEGITEEDATNAMPGIILAQTDSHPLSPSDSKEAFKTNSHCRISSAMYLYNSDMAIPECSENHQYTIMTQPNVTSPTPTISDDHAPGLAQQMLGPATPKLPASSCCSSSSSSTASTYSDMTYMTASTLLGVDDCMSSPTSMSSSLSSTGSSRSFLTEHTCAKHHDLKINVYDTKVVIEDKKRTDTLSESIHTPICSNAQSVSYSHSTNTGMVEDEEFSVDNNHAWLDTEHHEYDRSECGVLMSEETADNDDTSSWISGDNEDDNNLTVPTDSALQQGSTMTMETSGTTEYDSSTSSMCDVLRNGFIDKMEDEEESIDFGH